MRSARRLRNLTAHLRRVGTDERLRSAAIGYGRLDYPRATIHLGLSSRPEFYRLRSCEKEPWTVEWIERSLTAGDVLYDVGANVGAYSLLAAVAIPGTRVVAFEPGPANYAALCANIELNAVTERVTALPVALGADPGSALLGRDASVPGTSVELDGAATPDAGLTALVERLDDVVERFGLPLPTHLKLDVDGGELGVLAGPERVLGAERLRSAMVELDHDRADAIAERLRRLGLEQVERWEGSGRPRDAPSYGLFERR